MYGAIVWKEYTAGFSSGSGRFPATLSAYVVDFGEVIFYFLLAASLGQPVHFALLVLGLLFFEAVLYAREGRRALSSWRKAKMNAAGAFLALGALAALFFIPTPVIPIF